MLKTNQPTNQPDSQLIDNSFVGLFLVQENITFVYAVPLVFLLNALIFAISKIKMINNNIFWLKVEE